MDVEALAEFSQEGGPPDWAFPERATVGFAEVLQAQGFRAIFFVTRRAAEAHAALFQELEAAGHEMGLHLYPQDEGYPEYLGAFTGEEQARMIGEAAERFAAVLGRWPHSFQPGKFSANEFYLDIRCDWAYNKAVRFVVRHEAPRSAVPNESGQ